ncbi:MAG: nicotinate phosphoribosyltransferase [Ruminococcaceae bacterium]|nr:nicotinate phosphoribosyltransferase [Oscillospiraceae bacterium]
MNMRERFVNMTMLTDFYEITMANGYLRSGMADVIGYFDAFFRKVPDDGGFAIMAGLEQIIDYIENLHFTDEDIEYLRGKGIFAEEFLEYLRNFEFCCDIWAIEEGMAIFPNEPIIKVRGPIIQAQFIETALLLQFNHQSLVATKTNRIVRAANSRPVMEFGSRRAHGADAAINGARAAYIAGCSGTACTISDVVYGVPALGTMAHSWVQLFESEYDAFAAYAREYPQNCVLLVDTYDVLKSGVPNAIRVFNDVLAPMGYRPKGIRIDSGDITYLATKAREMLDDAGFPDCTICASNSLDEHLIREMLLSGAPLDSFGVGERLITASSAPTFGGVYKLAAIDRDGQHIPKIKISENVAKLTWPGNKEVWRLFDRDTGKAIADVVTLAGEVIDDTKPYEIFDAEFTWKRKVCENFRAQQLLKPIFVAGKRVYDCPPLSEIRARCTESVSTLWREVTRFENPHEYYVDYSQDLWDLRQRLISEIKKSTRS